MAIFKLRPNWLIQSLLHRRFVNSTTNSLKTAQCWNCNELITHIFCSSCKCLQKPDSNTNYFQLLGINENFNLNEVMLSKKFKDLQKVLHPDKYSNKSKVELKLSEEYSSLVNKAYSTLINPLSRGIYMLHLKGLELPEKTDLESTFLHEIMERNEEVENAESKDEILKLEQENKIILIKLQEKLNNNLKVNNNAEAIKLLVQMKYYISIDEQIKNVIRNMKIVK